MAAAFTACTEDFTDWASPQANGPEDAITIPGFSASAVAVQDLAKAGDEVATFSLNSSSLPEGFELGNARIELTPEGIEDADKVIVNTTIQGLASKETLQELIVTNYGKRPDVRTFSGHVLVNATKDGQALLIDAGTIKVQLQPEAPYIAPACRPSTTHSFCWKKPICSCAANPTEDTANLSPTITPTPGSISSVRSAAWCALSPCRGSTGRYS